MTNLITLNRFVKGSINEQELRSVAFHKIYKYNQFLSQPLALGMFVPCDRGKVLSEPATISEHQYQAALSRVIFEGFEYEVNRVRRGNLYIYFMKNAIILSYNPRIQIKSINDLAIYCEANEIEIKMK